MEETSSKRKKRKRHSSTSSSSDSERELKSRKHEKKKRKKEVKKKKKKSAKSNESKGKGKHHKDSSEKKEKVKVNRESNEELSDGPSYGPVIPQQILDNKANRPMTKQEWEKKQSQVRRVFDEKSGRHRLIRGDGEVIEEVVSQARHREINKMATAGDGSYFQSQVIKSSK